MASLLPSAVVVYRLGWNRLQWERSRVRGFRLLRLYNFSTSSLLLLTRSYPTGWKSPLMQLRSFDPAWESADWSLSAILITTEICTYWLGVTQNALIDIRGTTSKHRCRTSIEYHAQTPQNCVESFGERAQKGDVYEGQAPPSVFNASLAWLWLWRYGYI